MKRWTRKPEFFFFTEVVQYVAAINARRHPYVRRRPRFLRVPAATVSSHHRCLKPNGTSSRVTRCNKDKRIKLDRGTLYYKHVPRSQSVLQLAFCNTTIDRDGNNSNPRVARLDHILIRLY